ncbi:MAG: shikimate kinase I [Legionellales bacterium]|nr:shikimate kinase I [Legionellales bacterium]|tara:strand:- start:742 stop:1275 length:534 start_codon:yes stop_codon:yes gene_type:complete
MPHKNIYLIGPMGAGKSSIGLQLSKIAKLPFFDSDRELEKRAGVDIDWIYDIEGSGGLRDRERETLLDLMQQHPIVLSTGGGSVVIPEVFDQLKASGVVIYLKVSFKAQLQRTTRRPQGRPQLGGDDHKEKLELSNQQREPLYEALADLTYIASQMTPKSLAKRIWRDIQRLNNSSQ